MVVTVMLIGVLAPPAAIGETTPGDLDPSFGKQGLVITRLGSGGAARAIGVQPDGKIVAAGYASTNARVDFALARYHPDGSLDAEFGDRGTVTTDFSDVNPHPDPDGQLADVTGDYGNAIAIQADGKIVVAGKRDTYYEDLSGHLSDFALARYNADGSLDTTFGAGGRIAMEFHPFDNGHDMAFAVIVQPDGKIIAAGVFHEPYALKTFLLVRFNVDGSLDTTFGTGGGVTTSFGTIGGSRAFAVALQPDGKIVAVGEWFIGFAVSRYNPDGTPDETFGTHGRIASRTGQRALAVALQPDGKIIAAGTSGVEFVVARFRSTGLPDRSFGENGAAFTEFAGGNAVAHGIALEPDGKIVAAGTSESPFGLVLARYRIDGTLNRSFGSRGRVREDFGNTEGAFGVALQPDAKIVTTGLYRNEGSLQFALARFLG